MNFWSAAASLYQSIGRFPQFFSCFFPGELSNFFFLFILQQTMRASQIPPHPTETPHQKSTRNNDNYNDNHDTNDNQAGKRKKKGDPEK